MEFLRPKRVAMGLDMAPLIDCVFQLLIFFMLSSTFVNPALKLALPRATSAEKPDADQIVVSIDRDGKIFVNTDEIPLENLKAALQQRLAKVERKQVNFRGDRAMRYELFVRVMDIAKEAGAVQLNLVHETSEP
jgi:biopolymer transport protein ExbD